MNRELTFAWVRIAAQRSNHFMRILSSKEEVHRSPSPLRFLLAARIRRLEDSTLRIPSGSFSIGFVGPVKVIARKLKTAGRGLLGLFVEKPQGSKKGASPADRARLVQKMVEAQHYLSELCGISFESLSEAVEIAHVARAINDEEAHRFMEMNRRGNSAKHEDFLVGLLSQES